MPPRARPQPSTRRSLTRTPAGRVRPTPPPSGGAHGLGAALLSSGGILLATPLLGLQGNGLVGAPRPPRGATPHCTHLFALLLLAQLRLEGPADGGSPGWQRVRRQAAARAPGGRGAPAATSQRRFAVICAYSPLQELRHALVGIPIAFLQHERYLLVAAFCELLDVLYHRFLL